MAARTFILHSPVDASELMISRGRGHEKLSEISQFDLDLLSPSPNLDPTDFLGSGMTIEIINQFGNSRYINALVTSFHCPRGRTAVQARNTCTQSSFPPGFSWPQKFPIVKFIRGKQFPRLSRKPGRLRHAV